MLKNTNKEENRIIVILTIITVCIIAVAYGGIKLIEKYKLEKWKKEHPDMVDLLYTDTPAPSSTPTPIFTETPKPTETPVPTPTNTPIPTPTNTPVPSPTPTPEPTSVPTNTPIPTYTPKPTNIPKPSPTPMPKLVATFTPRPTPTPKPTPTPIPTPTNTTTPIPSPTPTPSVVTVESFISNLLAAQGQEDTSKAKAVEEGYILPSSYTDKEYKEHITRGEAIRIAVKAVEKKENPRYPDYLSAYKGLIYDFLNLGEYAEDCYKAVYLGLAPFNPDGTLQVEQVVREDTQQLLIDRVVDPSKREFIATFAEPDPEFEAFMNSPEVSKYFKMDFNGQKRISRVVDGKIIFGGYDWDGRLYGDMLIFSAHNRDINKIIYNAVRDLVKHVKQNDNYLAIKLGYLKGVPYEVHIVYYPNSRQTNYNYGQFYFQAYLKPYQLYPNWKYPNITQQYDTRYWWNIGGLFDDDDDLDMNDLTTFRTEEYMKPLQSLFINVYGENAGQFLYGYTISEYDGSRYETLVVHKNDPYYDYRNTEVKYYPEYNIEIQNANTKGSSIIFGTNKP